MNKKTCIAIMGPTAVGKTALAISVAQHLSTQIISADSRQCYKELDIGVAKPTPDELQLIKHHFINSHSIHGTVNAGIFEKYALEKIQEIFAGRDFAVMVGGTGLYLKTFCSGIDGVPFISPGVREKIIADYTLRGLEWLQQELQEKDPVYFSLGEIKNPHRLMRALEVKISTGKSIIEYQGQKNAVRDFNIIKIGLELPREELYQRIDHRVDAMITRGLQEEAKNLKPYRHLNALQTVGYKEMFDHYDDLMSLAGTISAIKTNTRHYAKRQLTWFKKDKEVKWYSPDIEQVIISIDNSITGN